MTEMPFWKFVVVQEVMKLPSLPAIYSACILNTANRKDGDWKFPAPTKELRVVLKKSSVR
jgi:hypothetical protein